MKEFAMNHPWMTFFLIGGMISGIVRIVLAVTGNQKQSEDKAKEEESHEPAGDIQ